MPNLCTLGGSAFHSTSIEVGPLPRTIGVSSNCLSDEPVQTVDFISGYQQVTIGGMFKPPNAEAEWAALKAEVANDENALTVPGASFRVFKNEGFGVNWELHSSVSGIIYYSVTLNCLP